jgi:hypothetical protein
MKIIKFMQQHHWAVASLSAAAVIATFHVKDVIREDTKQLLDTMNSAQQELRTDAFFLRINNRILETQLLVQQFGYGINDLDIATAQNDAKLMGERLSIAVSFNISVLGDTRNLFAMMGLIKEKFSDKLSKSMLDNLRSLSNTVYAQSGSLIKLQDRIVILTRRNSLNELALLYRNVKKDDPTRQPDGLVVQVSVGNLLTG